MKKNFVWYLSGAITTGFLLLTALVFVDPLPMIDREFSEEVQEHHNLLLDHAMKFISWFGDIPGLAILIGGTALLFLIYSYKKEALFIVLTGLSGLVSTLVKLLVNRPRPLPSLVRVIEKTQQQSFPSGHVLFYTVFFGFLLLLMHRLDDLNKKLRILISFVSIFLLFTVPVSRVYLGAHWFTDVLAGLFLGLLSLAGLSFFYLRVKDYKTQIRE
ncbi:phosphatase PAP2 family protein [Mucilaginibacter gilvus]|uniref:Phosphatase PAP2 family protein n=1 Tax=Mucilaginibacter gilvus TaxID=2305909 RepID=A0A3S3Z1X9_9SPHI|nr:phosphatase PAP2 family protein [Mucilaginibacter gilvus]RWY55409.1 phosphatase PAP2 family protein [Mucilaginibacter gilvus]